MKRLLPLLCLLIALAPACAPVADDDDDDDNDDNDDNDNDDDDDDDDDNDDDDDDNDNDDDNDTAPPPVNWRPCDDYLPALWTPLIPPDTLCGEVDAPADWLTPEDGNVVAVRFALVPATHQPPAATIALNLGGPDPNLRNLALFGLRPDAPVPAGLRDAHDLLFVETRGSSLSSTPLVCPEEMLGAPFASLDDYRTLVEACLDALPTDVSPALMTTADAARDLERIRGALGRDRLVLLGNSYGSRLMLEYLRRYETRVDAYVLDSTLAPQFSGRHFLDEILDTLALDCDAVAQCPFATGAALRDATDWLLNEAGDAVLQVGGWALTQDLFHLGDQPELLAAWPTVLAAGVDGDWSPMAAWHETAAAIRAAPTELPTERDRFYFDPYSDNVMCGDFPGWNDFAGREFVLGQLDPPYVPLAQIEAMTHIACDALAARFSRPPTVDRSPVGAAAPGLLIAPRLDQATPWRDAFAAVAAGLSGAAVVTVNADHAVLIDVGSDGFGLPADQQACLRTLLLTWLAAPFDPSTLACVDGLTAPLPLGPTRRQP